MSSNSLVAKYQELLEYRHQWDIATNAVKLSEEYGVPKSFIKTMVIKKQDACESMKNAKRAVSKLMSLGNNVESLGDGWTIIRFLDKQANTQVFLGLLKEEQLDLLRRDNRNERELTENEIADLVPAHVDDEAVEQYKEWLYAKGHELIMEVTGVNYLAGTLAPSFHAGDRYCERVLKIKNKQEANAYRRANWKQVSDAVVEGFKESELIWEGRDNITFHFNTSTNVMYVKGVEEDRETIITLYEMDFGFDKSINTSIVLQQAKVLAEKFGYMEMQKADMNMEREQYEFKVTAIDGDIQSLMAKVEELQAEKEQIQATYNTASKRYRTAKYSFVSEFNKLFAKDGYNYDNYK